MLRPNDSMTIECRQDDDTGELFYTVSIEEEEKVHDKALGREVTVSGPRADSDTRQLTHLEMLGYVVLKLAGGEKPPG